jgi:hypothetical protein
MWAAVGGRIKPKKNTGKGKKIHKRQQADPRSRKQPMILMAVGVRLKGLVLAEG